jgi:hypothetical protein
VRREGVHGHPGALAKLEIQERLGGALTVLKVPVCRTDAGCRARSRIRLSHSAISAGSTRVGGCQPVFRALLVTTVTDR